MRVAARGMRQGRLGGANRVGQLPEGPRARGVTRGATGGSRGLQSWQLPAEPRRNAALRLPSVALGADRARSRRGRCFAGSCPRRAPPRLGRYARRGRQRGGDEAERRVSEARLGGGVAGVPRIGPVMERRSRPRNPGAAFDSCEIEVATRIRNTLRRARRSHIAACTRRGRRSRGGTAVPALRGRCLRPHARYPAPPPDAPTRPAGP